MDNTRTSELKQSVIAALSTFPCLVTVPEILHKLARMRVAQGVAIVFTESSDYGCITKSKGQNRSLFVRSEKEISLPAGGTNCWLHDLEG